MNEAAIRQKLCEINEILTVSPSLGPAPKSPGGEGVYYGQQLAQEPALDATLEQLRLQVKYLLFDLEATRRENRYLRQMLEARHRGGADGHPDGDGEPV